MRFRTLLLSCALAGAGLSATLPARAECVSQGFAPGGTLCNGCRYEGSMSVSRGHACERPYRPTAPGGMGALSTTVIVSNRVVQRAKHGIAGASSNTWAYQPAPGFVGTDDFTTEARFQTGGQTGTFTVHWTVTVQ